MLRAEREIARTDERVERELEMRVREALSGGVAKLRMVCWISWGAVSAFRQLCERRTVAGSSSRSIVSFDRACGECDR